MKKIKCEVLSERNGESSLRGGVVAWLGIIRRCCMARIFDVIPAQAGIQKKVSQSHPEIISGSFLIDTEQVQHDKKKPGFPLLARMTYGTFLEPRNNAESLQKTPSL